MVEIVKATISKGGNFVIISDKNNKRITHKLINDYLRSLTKDGGQFFTANFVDNNWQLVKPSNESW